MPVVGIHHHRIGIEPAAIFKFHSTDVAALVEQLFHRRLQAKLTTHRGENIGHRLGNAIQAALHMIHPIAVLGEGKDAEQSRAMPRRHAKIFGLKGERELQPLVLEIIAQHIVHAPSREHMRQGLDQIRTQKRTEFVIGILQARVDRAELGTLLIHVAQEPATASGKHPLDLTRHLLLVAEGVHRGLTPTQLGHRVEIDKLQMIFALATQLGKNLIEAKFLVQKGRPQIERIITQSHFRIAATNPIVFLNNRDLESPMRQQHAGSQTTRPGTHYHHMFLLRSTRIPIGHGPKLWNDPHGVKTPAT